MSFLVVSFSWMEATYLISSVLCVSKLSDYSLLRMQRHHIISDKSYCRSATLDTQSGNLQPTLENLTSVVKHYPGSNMCWHIEAETNWTPFCRHVQVHFFNKDIRIPIRISLKFVPKGPINNNAALVQIMSWCHPGDKPLSEPMMVSLLMQTCVTQPQWVKLLMTR